MRCCCTFLFILAIGFLSITTLGIYLVDYHTFIISDKPVSCQKVNYTDTMATQLKAYVVGYTGETGKALVKELAKSNKFSSVTLIGRRTVEYDDPEMQKFEQKVIDFEKINDNKDWFSGYDVGFCALGSTRANAGSAEAFKHIDYDYVHNLAHASKQGGLKHFHYVSSSGANKNSMFLYPKTKGQIEEALANVMFPRLSIYRPKVLEAEQGRAEFRLSEKMFIGLLKVVTFAKPTMALTKCPVLARCLINNSFNEAAGTTEIVDNDRIYALAGDL